MELFGEDCYRDSGSIDLTTLKKCFQITPQMVSDGLKQGIIKPKYSYDEPICEIGRNWFWLFDVEDINEVPFDALVDCIVLELESLNQPDWERYKDEYLYYYFFLKENLH